MLEGRLSGKDPKTAPLSLPVLFCFFFLKDLFSITDDLKNLKTSKRKILLFSREVLSYTSWGYHFLICICTHLIMETF